MHLVDFLLKLLKVEKTTSSMNEWTGENQTVRDFCFYVSESPVHKCLRRCCRIQQQNVEKLANGIQIKSLVRRIVFLFSIPTLSSHTILWQKGILIRCLPDEMRTEEYDAEHRFSSSFSYIFHFIHFCSHSMNQNFNLI